MQEMGVFQAMHTARALRRLKPDPVRIRQSRRRYRRCFTRIATLSTISIWNCPWTTKLAPARLNRV